MKNPLFLLIGYIFVTAALFLAAVLHLFAVGGNRVVGFGTLTCGFYSLSQVFYNYGRYKAAKA